MSEEAKADNIIETAILAMKLVDERADTWGDERGILSVMLMLYYGRYTANKVNNQIDRDVIQKSEITPHDLKKEVDAAHLKFGKIVRKFIDTIDSDTEGEVVPRILHRYSCTKTHFQQETPETYAKKFGEPEG